jgi:hypothetical protein
MDVVGQLRAPAALPQVEIRRTHLIIDCVAITAGLDAVQMCKISYLCQKSNHGFSVVRPVA